MTLASAILALSPSHYWKLDTHAGDLTAADSVGSFTLSTVINDNGGSAGPEPGTTAQRLYVDQIWTSPNFGLSTWPNHSWLLVFTVPASGAYTGYSDILGLGDPSNRTVRGFRIQQQSTTQKSANFRIIGTANNVSVGTLGWPEAGWHYICWTISTGPNLQQIAYDGGAFQTNAATPGTAPISTDKLWIQSAYPIVMCHLAYFPVVLNTTQLASISSQMPTWPLGQVINDPGGSGGGGGDNTEVLAAISDVQEDVNTLLANWNGYQTVTLPSLQDMLNSLAAQSTAIQGTLNDNIGPAIEGVHEKLDTMRDQIDTGFTAVQAKIDDEVLPGIAGALAAAQKAVEGVTTKVGQAGGAITTSLGQALSSMLNSLSTLELTDGPTCTRVDQLVVGPFNGIRIKVTSRPDDLTLYAPDHDFVRPDYASVRLEVGGQLIRRWGVHQVDWLSDGFPATSPWTWAFLTVNVTAPNTHVIVDWMPGVCGQVFLSKSAPGEIGGFP